MAGKYGAFHGLDEIYAHRVSYRIFKGPIPDGMQVQHLCNTTLCVNPAHLVLGNQLSNEAHKVRCGRQYRGEVHWARLHPERLRGEKNGQYKHGRYALKPLC
jgi:hypothetical protein